MVAHDAEDGDGDGDHEEFIDAGGAGELGQEEPEWKGELGRLEEGEESPTHPGGVTKHGDIGIEKFWRVFDETFAGTTGLANDGELGSSFTGGKKEGGGDDTKEEPDGKVGVDEESAGVNADDKAGGDD